MAKEFSRAFYKSQAWKSCRDSYWRSRRGLCEDCIEKGVITSGEEVHHVIPLTPDNIGNPAITLSWNNLRLLCRECHQARHRKSTEPARYTINPVTGSVDIPPG